MKKSSLLVLPMVLGLVSCQETGFDDTPTTPKEQTQKEFSTKRAPETTDAEYIETLVRAGENLVNRPTGITIAHKLFNRVLKMDPNNNKALFYSAFTGILMTYDGVLNRGKGMLDNPNDFETIKKDLNERFKYPEFVDFLVGKKTQSKLNTYQDLKRFAQNEIVDSFESAVEKLNKIDGDVNVILSQEKTNTEMDCVEIEAESSEMGSEVEYSCTETVTSIDVLPAQTATVDAKDLKIIAGGIKGYATMAKFMTAYKITGQKHITNEVQLKELQLGRSLTDQEMAKIIQQHPEYLVLENDHRMNEMVSDLENMVEIAMDMEALNNQFCDTGLREDNLIKTICLEEGSREEMQKALDHLSGPQEVSLGVDKDGNEVKILMDLPGYLRNPIQDLKSLIPAKFDDEGKPIIEEEPNLNGLFPNNDYLEKTKLVVENE